MKSKNGAERIILEKVAKLAESGAESGADFLKMEDVRIKKILDFSGEMVHNGLYPIRLNKRNVLQNTQEEKRERRQLGQKIGSYSFGGMRKPSAEYIEMPVCEGLTHTFFEKRRFFVEKSFRWGNLNTAVKKG